MAAASDFPDLAAIATWLDGALNHERAGTFREIRLDRIRLALTKLPSPPAPVIIAGTKGKGSTVRLLETILVAHGKPTLAFTSPHVSSLAERWRLDGVPATAAALADPCAHVADLETATGLALTWFERTFCVAVLLAAARPGSAFLCEVGLGGRLDCANALDAAVTILTHLSHDHRDVLGPTLTHIAREKLAVARTGRPLLIAPQTADGEAAIRAVLAESDQSFAMPAASAGSAPSTLDAARAAVQRGLVPTWIQDPEKPFDLALPGAHQQGNAATALAAAHLIHPGIDETRARTAMAQARLAARCQLVTSGARRILVDGAHNGPSIAATLAVAARSLRPGWRLILGLASDKEIDEILPVIPAGLAVMRCGYRSTRARGETDWPPAAQAWPWRHDITQALSEHPDADACITGSFYLAGEALAILGQAGTLPG